MEKKNWFAAMSMYHRNGGRRKGNRQLNHTRLTTPATDKKGKNNKRTNKEVGVREN